MHSKYKLTRRHKIETAHGHLLLHAAQIKILLERLDGRRHDADVVPERRGGCSDCMVVHCIAEASNHRVRVRTYK